MLVAIKAELAKRIQWAQSTEQTRYYLNGFSVEPCQSGAGVNIVATDGHILACFRDAEGRVENPANADWPIVQLDSAALKACGAKSRYSLWLVLEGDVSKATLSVLRADSAEAAMIAHRSGSLEFVDYQAAGKYLIDGSFPAWRRVVPSGDMEPGASASFNPALLAKLGKCAEAKGNPMLTIERSKSDPHGSAMLVTGGNPALEWFGVLMPARGSAARGLPAWLNPPAPKPAEELLEAAE